MFHDLSKRFLTSSIAIAALIALLVFADIPFVSFIIVAIVALLAELGIREYIEIIKNKGITLNQYAMTIGAVVFIFLSAFSIFAFLPQVFAHTKHFQFLGKIPLFLIFILPLVVAFIEHLKAPSGFALKASLSAFGLIYVVLPLSFIFPLLYMQFIDGKILLAWIIAVTKGSDIFAYIFGRIIGKHKLAPIASPNKTWEGAIFAVIGSILISLLFATFFSHGFSLSIISAIIGGAVLGIGGQIGDLFESLLKRDANIKDSSKIPGLGGILDSLDSLLFNIPLAYFFFISSPM